MKIKDILFRCPNCNNEEYVKYGSEKTECSQCGKEWYMECHWVSLPRNKREEVGEEVEE